MQNKPKTGDLFDRGPKHHYKLVALKAHRQHQYITILNGELGNEFPKGSGLAIDYPKLTSGGTGFNAEGKAVKIWKVKGD